LRSLSVDRVDVDETFWSHISETESLRNLKLSHAHITLADDGRSPTELQNLDISFSTFADPIRGTSRLAKISGLAAINLMFTNVDLNGLDQLRAHPGLRYVNLGETPALGPLPVEALSTIPHLEFVSGWLTGIEERELARPWERLPWCWSSYPTRSP
jgi:hypothetical protein